MKLLITIAVVLTALACQQPNRLANNKETPSLIVDDLKYSAYSWYYPKGKWEFYLDYYVHVDKSGNFMIMLHDSLMNTPKYYGGIISDSLRNCINKLFSIDTLKEDYRSAKPLNIAYDGFTYCIDLKKAPVLKRRYSFHITFLLI